MFVVFYTVNMYTLSIYDLFHTRLYDTLMDPWNVRM
jgi:hypothetical protein